MLSPSYLKSIHCRYEWNHFVARELALHSNGILAVEQGLIFPILLFPLDRGRYDVAAANFQGQIKTRQWHDLSSRLRGTPLRPSQIREIVETLIDVTTDLISPAGGALQASETVVVDHAVGLTWAASLSDQQMSFDQAKNYVTQLAVAGFLDWRLPTKAELESIIVATLVDPEPKADTFPLKQPFRS